MHHVDDFTFKLTSLFFALNSALLIAVIGFISLHTPLFLLLAVSFIGYFSSASSFLIEGKFQLFSWFVFLKRAREIEKDQDVSFRINQLYEEELKKSWWRFVAQGRITYIFKISFVMIWMFIILYITWAELSNLIFLLIVVVILVTPWASLILASFGYSVKEEKTKNQ